MLPIMLAYSRTIRLLFAFSCSLFYQSVASRNRSSLSIAYDRWSWTGSLLIMFIWHESFEAFLKRMCKVCHTDQHKVNCIRQMEPQGVLFVFIIAYYLEQFDKPFEIAQCCQRNTNINILLVCRMVTMFIKWCWYNYLDNDLSTAILPCQSWYIRAAYCATINDCHENLIIATV